MASKRKSSTPCMIPSKAPRLNEGDQDSPIYLGPSRISEIDRNAAADLGEEREATEAKDGTYTCRPYFRADSCFLCLTCGISSAKFEGLALHNARVHPSTLNTSLQLKVKDKRVMVEQTFVNTTEMGKDIEIAISKTPIMRMLKGKSEPKKIVVSTAKVMPSAIQIVNGSGALPMLKTPITSIPTYSASMDESSFLKTSFSKFPYPTKAELCYLTVVTKFPEEQIKIWFTAQRLKQGISWSPEEIEEARRKMFNTIIQTAPATSASLNSTAQHTIVLPASLGATGLSQILQGSLVNHGGVIVTQPMMANGIQVSSAPVALAVTPKPQAAARPMMQARPTAALVADKGVSMVIGTVGSSSGKKSQEQLGALKDSFLVNQFPDQEEVDRLIALTGLTVREVRKWFSDRRYHLRNLKGSRTSGGQGKDKTSGSSSAPGTPANPLDLSDTKMTRREIHGWFTERRKRMGDASDCSAVNSQNTPSSSPGPTQSSKHSSTPKTIVSPKPTSYRGKKTPDQLHMLKKIYARTQWPSATQYDELISGTGLPRPEVVRWFGDCRYVQKNGQLKWLEAYQRTVLTEDLEKGNDQALQAHLDSYGRLNESELEDLTEASGLTPDLVKYWFSTKASSFQLPQTTVTTTEAAVPGSESEAQLPGSSSPMEPQPGAGNEEKMEQSVCGVSKDE
uniref:Zinc fingers and homeoboxes 3 n=1 Tax=Neogobius melanostomus TaxID=47308 RepID=A0A8C6T8K8_9GOBI